MADNPDLLDQLRPEVLRQFSEGELQQLSKRYRRAEPFPHICLDGLFPADVLEEIRQEVSNLSVDPEKNSYSTYLKRRISDFDRLPPATRRLVGYLNSAAFLTFLERITGITGLIADPYLEGGGVHQIGTGGYLKIHTDFNYHERLKLHRRLNLLLYLNPGWKEEWGGAVEFWDDKVTEKQASYAPLFNRTVIFSTTDQSYHGHPDPLTCPEDVCRNSIALYYYTAERPVDEVRFGHSTMTNYQTRPKERFAKGRVHHLVNQLEIRLPIVRRLLNFVRRLR